MKLLHLILLSIFCWSSAYTMHINKTVDYETEEQIHKAFFDALEQRNLLYIEIMFETGKIDCDMQIDGKSLQDYAQEKDSRIAEFIHSKKIQRSYAEQEQSRLGGLCEKLTSLSLVGGALIVWFVHQTFMQTHEA